jgi:Helix-turn-helix domain
MSATSHKSQWQKALLKSGLGHRAVGTGLSMSLYANADGTRMWPAMTTLAEDMGCDRKYVTGGRDTLAEYDWLAFVAEAIPGHRGKEFLPTFGRRQVSLSGTQEAVAQCPPQDGPVSFLEAPVSFSGAPSVPLSNVTMQRDAPCSKTMEEHHEPTGDAAWDAVEAEAKAKAAALAEAMTKAPPFD